MQPLTLYEELLKLNSEPSEFVQKADAVWEQFFGELPSDKEKRARQFKQSIDGQLENITQPTDRMNKMLELFWQGFDSFQLSLTHPSSLIVRSQDGSHALVLPITQSSRR